MKQKNNFRESNLWPHVSFLATLTNISTSNVLVQHSLTFSVICQSIE
jgi:hypothetical protein